MEFFSIPDLFFIFFPSFFLPSSFPPFLPSSSSFLVLTIFALNFLVNAVSVTNGVTPTAVFSSR